MIKYTEFYLILVIPGTVTVNFWLVYITKREVPYDGLDLIYKNYQDVLPVSNK